MGGKTQIELAIGTGRDTSLLIGYVTNPRPHAVVRTPPDYLVIPSMFTWLCHRRDGAERQDWPGNESVQLHGYRT